MRIYQQWYNVIMMGRYSKQPHTSKDFLFVGNGHPKPPNRLTPHNETTRFKFGSVVILCKWSSCTRTCLWEIASPALKAQAIAKWPIVVELQADLRFAKKHIVFLFVE